MRQGRVQDRNRPKRGQSSTKKGHEPASSRKQGSYSDLKPEGSSQKQKDSNRREFIRSEGPKIPSGIEDLISGYIKEKTGKSSDDPVFLDRLRQAIVAQKASYWREKPGKSVKYGRGYDILSYLAYQLPVYFTQFRSLLNGLFQKTMLPQDLVALDIGTGPGVVPLALIDLWQDISKGSLDIHAVERSPEHIEAFRSLVFGYAQSNSHIKIHPVIQEDLTKITDLNHPDLPKKADIISFQNVLAELEYLSIPVRASIVLSYARLLSEKGFLIIVEPAELRHATSLRLLQKELTKNGLHVYAPCPYLWGSGCEPSSCWTFQEEPSIQPTSLMKLLAGEEEGFRFINTDLKFAYVILTRQPISRCTYRIPRKNRFVRLSHLERYDGRVISVAGSRMSNDIGSRGMHIFKLCDGTCRDPVYIVLSTRNRRPNHAPLFSSGYGDPLIISGVQVRRHHQHKAWNLVLSADSRIERVPSPEIKTDLSYAKQPSLFDDKMKEELTLPGILNDDSGKISHAKSESCNQNEKNTVISEVKKQRRKGTSINNKQKKTANDEIQKARKK